MKKVWSNANIVECDLMKVMLEANGITCFMRNEDSARVTGVGYGFASGTALQFVWPELWVADEDEERARSVINDFTKESDTSVKT